jgi:osmotically-inducible protein OsmY
MDIRCRNKRRSTCLFAIPLACALVAFASQVHGQNATSQRAAGSTTEGSSAPTVASAVMNRQLLERVRAALHAAPYLDDRHISVTVESGAVVLSGLVFSAWDLRDALRIARQAAGNRPVVDNLSIEEGGR